MRIMKKLSILVLLVMIAGGVAQAGATFNFNKEGTKKLEIGADEQFRAENYSRSIMAKGGPEHADTLNGTNYQYLRMRERVWGKLTLSPDVFAYGRVAHRWQYFTSRPGKNNIPTTTTNDVTTTTWRSPDEVVLDNLYLNLDKLGETNWSLRLGRFDLTDGPKADPVFGNGMIMKDGTRGDGGRTFSMDGVMASWKGEKDTVRLAGLYGAQKDWITPVNDQDRILRRGDTWATGGAWTHEYHKAFKTELSYFHFDIDNQYGDKENAQMDVPVVRAFGDLHPLVDYSLEYAREYGDFEGKDAKGFMLDARLNIKTPAGTQLQPVLKLEYTVFSGDDPNTTDEFEGWHPLLADGAALYREECYYIVNGGRWTNLHLYRAQVDMTIRPGDAKHGNTGKLVVAPGWTTLHAERGEYGKGNGTHIGEMPSLFVDYQVKSWWKASLQTAYLFAGDYYDPSRDGGWVRLEMTFTY